MNKAWNKGIQKIDGDVHYHSLHNKSFTERH